MATDTRYNGWSNYPTWNWKLWIDNDEGLSEHWKECARECYRDAKSRYAWRSHVDAVVSDLEEMLRSHADEPSDATGNLGPKSDILGWAMGQIDFREIAESMIGDLDDDEKKDLRADDEAPDDKDPDDAESETA